MSTCKVSGHFTLIFAALVFMSIYGREKPWPHCLVAGGSSLDVFPVPRKLNTDITMVVYHPATWKFVLMASLVPVDAGMEPPISMSPRRCCSPTDTDRKSEQRRCRLSCGCRVADRAAYTWPGGINTNQDRCVFNAPELNLFLPF